MSPLLALPTELVDHIVASITDRETLWALNLTCSQLRAFAEVQLFQDVRVHSPRSAQHLEEALNARPQLYSLVKRFEPSIPEGHEGWPGFPELARRMTQLKELWIEVGYGVEEDDWDLSATTETLGWMKEFESVITGGLGGDTRFSKLTSRKSKIFAPL